MVQPLDLDEAMDPRSVLSRFSAPIAKRYRLINASFEAHPQLDAFYDCLDDALNDAVSWLGTQPPSAQSAIGVEVSTRAGEWRTVRYPGPLAPVLTT